MNFLMIVKEQNNDINNFQDEINLNKNEYNLGRILLEFLNYYGQEFKNDKEFIHLRSQRKNINNSIYNLFNIMKVINLFINRIQLLVNYIY